MKFHRIFIFFILAFFPLYGQIEISGIVRNADGEKLPGANIILSGILVENSIIIEKLLQSINFKINDNIIKNEWLCISAIKS